MSEFSLLATPRNMKECEDAGINAVAFSPHTGEQCSVTSGDYFLLDPDESLRDSFGNDMYLATVREIVEPVVLP